MTKPQAAPPSRWKQINALHCRASRSPKWAFGTRESRFASRAGRGAAPHTYAPQTKSFHWRR
eukprot:7680115-Pyramimonas_sp.AAC.1